MTEINVEQGTKEWLMLRLGKITGTRLGEIFKSDNLPVIDEMIAEIVTEHPLTNFSTKAVEEGKENEPLARLVYQEVKDIAIEEVGFCLSDTNDYLALSPDGFTIDRMGGVEIKCPQPKTHVKYIRQDKLPAEYKYQVYAYFLVNPKLEWLDFVSFNASFKEKPMFIKRINRIDIVSELDSTQQGVDKFILKFEKYYKQVIN